MGVIQFKNVGKVFGPKESGFVALKDINLEIADKEFVAIVGPSGCGKTTCLRLVAGFDNPTDGAVMVDGTPIKRPGPNRAVVFQQFALFPWKSVYDNIDIGLRNLNVPKAERQSRIAAILNLMNLEPYAEHFPHQLSGGMQQRVAIARAYVLDPDVLLMD